MAKRILDWAAEQRDLTLWFGGGRKDGSFQPGRYGDRYLFPFALYTYGRVEISFQYIARRPPF